MNVCSDIMDMCSINKSINPVQLHLSNFQSKNDCATPSFLSVLVSHSLTRNLFLSSFNLSALSCKIAFLNTSVPHVLQVCKMQDTFGKYPLYSHRLLSIASPTSLGMPDKYLDASLSMFSKFWHFSQQLCLNGIRP